MCIVCLRPAIAKGTRGQAFPEGAADRASRQARHHLGTDVLRQLRPLAERGGQQRLDAAAHRLAENGRGASSGNTHHQRRAIDDGTELELAELRPVDDIIGHAQSLGGSHERFGLRIVLDLGYGQRRAFEIGRRPGAVDERNAGCVGHGLKRRAAFLGGRIDTHFGARCRQQLDLPGRRLTAADGDHRLALEVKEHRQHSQWGDTGPIRLRRRDDVHR